MGKTRKRDNLRTIEREREREMILRLDRGEGRVAFGEERLRWRKNIGREREENRGENCGGRG